MLFGLAIVSVVRAEYGKARRYAERCLAQAERAKDAALLVQAHWVLGLSLQYMGDLVESRTHLERSVALYDPQKHATHVFLYGAILNRAHLARVLLYMGYPDEAHALVGESVATSEKMRHPVGLCNALSVAVTLEAFHGNTERILEMTTAMHTCGHTCKQTRPRPAVSLTFWRKARRILSGYAFQPSVYTNSARRG